MEYTHTVKKYTVLLTTEEIVECDNLKVLYDEIRRRIRWGDEKFTAYLYQNIEWWKTGFEEQTPFFQMGTE